jgi:hypothetical protein
MFDLLIQINATLPANPNRYKLFFMLVLFTHPKNSLYHDPTGAGKTPTRNDGWGSRHASSSNRPV